MKKIKLAVLAVCLLTGVVGAYGTSKKAAAYTYWAAPGYLATGSQVLVSSAPPTSSCTTNPFGQYICRFSSPEPLNVGDLVEVTEIDIAYTYN